MIADSEWTLCRPWRSSSPVNAATQSVDRYRRMPPGLAFVAVSVVSSVLAVISGVLGGFAAMYLYDRGMSKGDDLAVFLGGFFAVGTCIFVLVFTRLEKVRHAVSSRTSVFAFYACLALPAIDTVLLRSNVDRHYLPFVLCDWLAIPLSGLAAVFLCRRWRAGSDQRV